MNSWKLTTAVVELPLAQRFTISRGSTEVARNLFVTVELDGMRGVGEVSPDDRAGESAESLIEELKGVNLDALASAFDLEGILELLPPGSARCALDIALHDLAARRAGLSVAALLGVAARPLPPTSVTLPIDEPRRMVERAASLSDHPVLKMKVGFDGDVEAVGAVRDAYGGALRIDANEGWDEAEAIDRLGRLERYDIELCEQPIPARDPQALQRVTRSTSIRVFADEDVCTSRDVVRLAGSVDGVNLKLRKCGGLREALRAIATARAEGLGVMLGCDLESGIAATAQASVIALVDHADIDGPLLLREDPFPGVTYARGAVTLPNGPGLGVVGWPESDPLEDREGQE